MRGIRGAADGCAQHPKCIRWYRSQTALYGNLVLPLLIPSAAGQRQRHRLVGWTLIIGSVAAEDESRYVCPANNSAGLVQSRTQIVYREINLKPIINPDY